MKHNIFAILGALLFAGSAWGGQLQVNTFFESRPFKGLEIQLDGRVIGVSGEQGEVTAPLAPGAHTLVCSKSDATLARHEFVVAAGESAKISVRFTDFLSTPEITLATFDADGSNRAGVPVQADGLAPQSDFSDVEEVMVLGTYKPQDDTSTMERFSVAITDAISIEDLLRFGDSDVAAALKRIVGVAVTGGKYANVRGLAGRYISSTLNGSLMPSTDPFRRDVQLDLFPSEILGGIEIQKSFTADLPGDTTGGVIRMTTRGLPDEDTAGLSLSLAYLSGVTGKDLLGYQGGDTDFLGVDDGNRALPGAVRSILGEGGRNISRVCAAGATGNCVQPDQYRAIVRSLPLIYNPSRDSAAPHLGLAGKFGRRLERENGDLGYYAAVTYSQSSGSRQQARFENVQGDANGKTIWDTYNAAINGYLVVGWVDDAGWSLTSKTVVLRDTEDRTSIEDFLDTTNSDVRQVETTLEWVERQFIGQQVEGQMPLFGTHALNWRLGLSRTNRESPDRRFYVYRADTFSVQVFERSYADLVEDSQDLGLDYAWPINITDSIYTNLKFGLLLNRRDRDNAVIRLGVSGGRDQDQRQDPETLLAPDNFGNGSGEFRLRAATTTTDAYKASRETQAAYVSSETDFGADWSLTLGVRVEDYALDLDYPFATGTVQNPSTISDRDSTDVLPGLNLTYRMSDSIQLRGGLSRTVSRPDTTELAQSVFYDTEGRAFRGCPRCEDSTIDNIDLRGEWYFSDRDSVSLAIYHKQIDAPLEVTIDEATEVIRTFENGDSAEVSGVELDASYRVYDGIDHVVSLSGNLAWIDSEIQLGEDAARIEKISSRQLQGQSPFLANIQASYDNYPLDATFTLVLNYFDDRIDSVSRGDAAYLIEAGRLDANLNAEKTFRSGSKIKLKIKNLLDSPIERTQDGRIRETYEKGVSVSLGYSLNF